MCLDAGACGQNSSQPDFPFSYASIQDAVAMMTPGCFMAKLDLAHMYLTLGLAMDSSRESFSASRTLVVSGDTNWPQVFSLRSWLKFSKLLVQRVYRLP